MRKRTPAISLAMAWKAPPSTRSVTGSTSTRSRVGGPGRRPTSYSVTDISDLQCLGGFLGLVPGRAADCDHDVAEPVDRGGEPRGNDSGRVVLMDDRRPREPVPRLQRQAVVVPCLDFLQLAADPEPRRALVPKSLLRCLVAALHLSGLERRHEADPAHADVGDLDVGLLEAPGVLALVDVMEVGAELLRPCVVDRSRADVHPQLVALAGVAGVHHALDHLTVGGNAVLLELAARLLFEFGEAAVDLIGVEC